MTAYGTVETAVEAMREGAYDFVEKPLKRMQIVKTVRKAAERHALLAREPHAARASCRRCATATIVGSSPALRQRARGRDAGRALDRDRAGARRERHRQGAARAPHPRAQRRAKGPFVGGEPRRAARDASSRASCSATRRARSPAPVAAARRAHRAGRRRHAVPRRDRRALAARAGEAAARAAGGRVRAARRHAPQRADFRLVAATNRDLMAEVARAASARTCSTAST